MSRRAVACALALAFVGCGDSGTPEKPKPLPRPVADPTATFNIHQITLHYGKDKPERSHHDAFALAEKLIARAKAGERFENLILEATDDLTPEGKPFNDGDYTVALKGAADPVLVKYVRNLKPGEIGETPYDSGRAILVIRRDR